MSHTPLEILRFVEENDVKFIRLTFCDMFGSLKNIAIMPNELEHAFTSGIPFDASFFDPACSDLLLFPDIATLSVLPWRPASGRVVRFFCSLRNPDGSDYAADMRTDLIGFINKLRLDGYNCEMGTKCEFYLFELDSLGKPTTTPHDNGGYLDVAPLDRCENPRREICLSLEEMGLSPRSSCHKHGPGQNEIEFRVNEPVTAADDMVHYKTVVKSISAQNGLFASFMPLPPGFNHGSALCIPMTVRKNGENIFSDEEGNITNAGKCFVSGILRRIREMTAFLNPTANSFDRFGTGYAPRYVDWSCSNLSTLLRIPASMGYEPRIELRSADAACNPYIAFKLLLAAGMESIRNNDTEFYDNAARLSGDNSRDYQRLPSSPEEAVSVASSSEFIHENLPSIVIDGVLSKLTKDAAACSGMTAELREQFYRKTCFEYL